MSKGKKFRFSVPISDELKELLDELSALSGQPRSELAGELLDSTAPVLRDMLEAFRRIAEAKEQGIDAIRDVVNDYAQESLRQIYEVGAEFNAQNGSDSVPAATGTSQKK